MKNGTRVKMAHTVSDKLPIGLEGIVVGKDEQAYPLLVNFFGGGIQRVAESEVEAIPPRPLQHLYLVKG